MGTWPALTEEQYAVIVTAYEEAAIGHILDEFRARQRWAETGTTTTPSDLDLDAKRALVPHFARVLADMVSRGWVDLFRGYPTKGSVELTAAEVAAVVNEPTSWISELDDWEVIGLATGDEWDRLTGAWDRLGG
ncbi:hypothetical protein [Catellatospora sp. NPDC049133]|uniref:hypothetical protein n=1 Tax=Catellatospora sp. NPDC049133 TaxID=3155499 RepID=UPI0033F1451A